MKTLLISVAITRANLTHELVYFIRPNLSNNKSRTIQTILVLFVHTFLHCIKLLSDDCGLWVFAVKHAFGFYNHIPNYIYGLMQIEYLIQTKANHHNLHRHVYDYHIFALDHKLECRQTILKWKCQYHLSHFIGFIDVNSSLIVQATDYFLCFIALPPIVCCCNMKGRGRCYHKYAMILPM